MLKIVRSFASFASRTTPTATVPDAPTFLAKIGRNMSQYAEHFDSWDNLMNAKSKALKAKGIDTRDRRYLLAWIERYKQNVDPVVYKRGRKRWGGERNCKANKTAYYGRKKAEEKNA
ncbi:Fyv4 protein [Starmerella bacillaris]|uniref:Small ribosomal subunit protein mS41 n=1 Tax=Starmerella bacillaris TaxID=1247836 RepID=A0AAV5REC4_STABA|nr:Fyv4 protein [Starmerella bacillaris]